MAVIDPAAEPLVVPISGSRARRVAAPPFFLAIFGLIILGIARAYPERVTRPGGFQPSWADQFLLGCMGFLLLWALVAIAPALLRREALRVDGAGVHVWIGFTSRLLPWEQLVEVTKAAGHDLLFTRRFGPPLRLYGRFFDPSADEVLDELNTWLVRWSAPTRD